MFVPSCRVSPLPVLFPSHWVYEAGWLLKIPRWHSIPVEDDYHHNTDWVQHRVTLLIDTNAVSLSYTATKEVPLASRVGILLFKIAQSYTSVPYLLWNGSTYSDEIWHADSCHPCAGPLLGFTSIGGHHCEEFNILFEFSNANKLAIDRFGLCMVGWSAAESAV